MMRAALFSLVVVALCGGCAKKATEPMPDLYGRMYGTWLGVLKDAQGANPLVQYYADSVQVVVEPGSSGPAVQMWQLKLTDLGGSGPGSYRVSDGATWRPIAFLDCDVVGSLTEGGNVYAHTEPDSVGGTVPGRTIGDYVFWIGPGNEPAGPGATVHWSGSVYASGQMALERQ